MFSSLPCGSYMDERISKSYSKEVLLANWQELRGGSAELNDCIVPGLKRVNACVDHLTDMKDNYIPPWCADEADDATRHFLTARNESLHNNMKNSESQVRFPLTAGMANNCTTTYTIVYDIVPRQQKLAAAAAAAAKQQASVPARPQDLDLMLSYGNRSITGERCRRRAELQLEKSQKWQTTYAATYDPTANALKFQPALKPDTN